MRVTCRKAKAFPFSIGHLFVFLTKFQLCCASFFISCKKWALFYSLVFLSLGSLQVRRRVGMAGGEGEAAIGGCQANERVVGGTRPIRMRGCGLRAASTETQRNGSPQSSCEATPAHLRGKRASGIPLEEPELCLWTQHVNYFRSINAN